jgi:5-methylcytosine-specific restriction endonuclease McrA
MSLTEEELAILTATPTDELDHAKIKWPKMKWKRRRGKTTFTPKKKKVNRKSHHQLEEILTCHGRQIHYCEDCGQQYGELQIHHKDGNPNNNHIDNLVVLCKGCHAERHKIADLIGVKEWHIGTIKE